MSMRWRVLSAGGVAAEHCLRPLPHGCPEQHGRADPAGNRPCPIAALCPGCTALAAACHVRFWGTALVISNLTCAAVLTALWCCQRDQEGCQWMLHSIGVPPIYRPTRALRRVRY
eukprot:2606261-Rhodomonas_salina.2